MGLSRRSFLKFLFGAGAGILGIGAYLEKRAYDQAVYDYELDRYAHTGEGSSFTDFLGFVSDKEGWKKRRAGQLARIKEEEAKKKEFEEIESFYAGVFGLDLDDKYDKTFLDYGFLGKKDFFGLESNGYRFQEYKPYDEETKNNFKYLSEKVGPENAYRLIKLKDLSPDEIDKTFIDSHFEEHDGFWVIGSDEARYDFIKGLDFAKQAPESYEFIKKYKKIIRETKPGEHDDSGGSGIIAIKPDKSARFIAIKRYMHTAAHEGEDEELGYNAKSSKIAEVYAFNKQADMEIELYGKLRYYQNRYEYVYFSTIGPQYRDLFSPNDGEMKRDIEEIIDSFPK